MKAPRHYWLAVVLFGAASVSVFAEAAFKMDYVFTPDLTNAANPVLHVRLKFQGNQSGTSTIVLPSTWAGQRDLYRAVQNLKATNSASSIVQGSAEFERIVRYPPRHEVELTYDLTSDWTGLLRHPKEFRVVLRSTNFIFNGQNGLGHPEISPGIAVHATFEWRELPPEWIVASSYGVAKDKLRFRGQWHDIQDGVFAAGDFRITRLHASGEELLLAARGTWRFSDQQASEEVMRLFLVEREFWRETKRDRFLVILAPFDQEEGSSDGTAFTGCFLLYLSKQQTFRVDIKSQLAHEIFHTWNPYRMSQNSGDATEWFTEGFTKYYQDRILLRAKLISDGEYVERLNQVVAAYWLSPDRNWPQQQWLERKNTGRPEYELPYKRGAIIALWLDETIRKSSGNTWSLDDRMRTLLQTKSSRLTTELLLSVLGKSLSSQAQEQLRSFVEDGVTISLPEKLEPICAALILGGAQPHYERTGGKGCEL